MILRNSKARKDLRPLRHSQRGFLLNPFRFGGGSASGDQLYTNNVLLLHFNGADSSTTITDNSPAARVPTGSGCVIKTAQFKWNGSSGYFNGASAIGYASSADFNFTGDFTIEGWIYPTDVSGTRNLITRQESGSGVALQWRISAGALQLVTRGAGGVNLTSISGGSISANVWQYIIGQRRGKILEVFIGTVLVGSATEAALNNLTCTRPLYVGDYDDGSGASQYFLGYMADLRITKGIARYYGSVTIPTGPFFDSTGTLVDSLSPYNKALFHFDGNLNDTSPLARPWIANGNFAFSGVDKFFGSGAGYSDGSGDYLSSPSPSDFVVGTGDFDVCLLFKILNQVDAYRWLWSCVWNAGGSSYSFDIRFGNSGFGYRLQVGLATDTLAGVYSTSMTQSSLAGSWHLLQFRRIAGVCDLYVDSILQTVRNNNYAGPAVTSWSDTNNLAAVTAVSISKDTTNSFYGYVDESRFTAHSRAVLGGAAVFPDR